MNTTQALELTEARRLLQTGEARRIREAAGLSLQEVGEVVGTSSAALSRWETGQRRPTGRAALRYARLLARLSSSGGTP
jgi:DNA-binding transcriptional regulator YiaG